MTANELYDYGRKSEPAMAWIPKELVQSLPKLERKQGRIVVQYWYYLPLFSMFHEFYQPLYYAAFDIRQNRLVEMEALTDCSAFIHGCRELMGHPYLPEVKYLEFCAELLNHGDITEEEIIHTQAMWLNAQIKDMFDDLYHSSDIRPEAVQKLLSPEMAESSRYLLKIWHFECKKYKYQKAPGYQALDKIFTDPVLEKEEAVFWELYNRGPALGFRFKDDI